MSESFSGNLNPNLGQAVPGKEGDPFASYDIGAVPVADPTQAEQIPMGVAMGPHDPYEMLAATPPGALTRDHVVNDLNAATPLVYETPKHYEPYYSQTLPEYRARYQANPAPKAPELKPGESPFELRQLGRHEIERRERLTDTLFRLDANGRPTSRPEVPGNVRMQLGAHRIKLAQTLAPLRRLEQPIAPFRQTDPTTPIGEILAREHIDSIVAVRGLINVAKQELQNRKKAKIDNSGHTYNMPGRMGKLGLWNLLNRFEARVTRQQGVKEAKADLKAAKGMLEPLHERGKELVRTGDRAVRNYLIQNDPGVLPRGQRRTAIRRNRRGPDSPRDTVNFVQQKPVRRP